MDRITATPNYAVGNCSDLCGNMQRYGDDSGAMTCGMSGCGDCIILKAFKRLKEYEDTGLSPDDIRRLTIPSLSPLPIGEDWEKFWRDE